MREPASFSELLAEPSVQKASQGASAGAIAWAFASAAFVGIFRNWDFGLWWVLIAIVLMFAVSILVAAPFQMFRYWLIWKNAPVRRPIGPWLLLIDGSAVAICLVGTYYALRALWFGLFANG